MIVVDDWEEATHWIPELDENIDLGNVTLGKMYEIFRTEEDDFIVDDEGCHSLVFCAIKGKLVKAR